jgi:hypothetical protein
MIRKCRIASVVFIALSPAFCHSEDLTKEVRKAVERSTLDQPGTKPFHLQATVAPSLERDKDSGRTGEVEIWWTSPTQWKREVRSPEFHQVEIVDGGSEWEKNEGDYFPEWLREAAVEVVKPVPPLDEVLDHVKAAEVRRIGLMTNLSWTTPSGTPDAKNILRAWVALQESTGLLLYAGGLGWGGEFKDYEGFHGRMIARTVNVGSPQVTAKVVVLEDFGNSPPEFFNTKIAGADVQPLQTITLDEISLRKNLIPLPPAVWPPLQDGPLEGNITAQIVVDREGKVRELKGGVVADNPGVRDAGKQAVEAMRFQPFVVDGVPVQVTAQVTIPFKTVRPAGTEAFDSARNYFERGRRASFPAAGAGAPYALKAEFSARSVVGAPENGRYEDTWVSENQWRREAWFAGSHYVRSRNGDKFYQFAEGTDAPLLRIVFEALEPIPAVDTFTESDWRIRRDTVSGTPAVKVLSGYESPDGKLDPNSRAYWFDDNGLLLKAYFKGLETWRIEFADFASLKVARRIDVLKGGGLAMQINITELVPAGAAPSKTFEVRGHEWTRAFTAEAR